MKLYGVQVTEFSFSCEPFLECVSGSSAATLIFYAFILYLTLTSPKPCIVFGCFVTVRGFSAFDFSSRGVQGPGGFFGAIPHSGIASNRNFLLFFLPWILRSVLHSGMSYPLSAAFDYSLPNTAPLYLRPVPPLLCFA